ncbi:MAG: LysM peptidoglycan-binding domain-containing protein, partial [Terriglobales bacterium]
VDATAEQLLDLNPSLLRMTTPKVKERATNEIAAQVRGENGTFELHLPAGTADKFQTAVAAIPPDKRVWWRYHKVQAGESLAAIARTYHTTPRAIAEANELGLGSGNDTLVPEARLIIPIAPGKQADTSTYARGTTRYKVRKGDTVASVAENFGVSEKMLRGWNHLKGGSLAGRKILYIHLPLTPGARETQVARRKLAPRKIDAGSSGTKNASPSQRPSGTKTEQATAVPHPTLMHHKVKQGETLYSIASSYNTTVSALKHDNRNIASLRPGMILIVRDVR